MTFCGRRWQWDCFEVVSGGLRRRWRSDSPCQQWLAFEEDPQSRHHKPEEGLDESSQAIPRWVDRFAPARDDAGEDHPALMELLPGWMRGAGRPEPNSDG